MDDTIHDDFWRIVTLNWTRPEERRLIDIIHPPTRWERFMRRVRKYV